MMTDKPRRRSTQKQREAGRRNWDLRLVLGAQSAVSQIRTLGNEEDDRALAVAQLVLTQIAERHWRKRRERETAKHLLTQGVCADCGASITTPALAAAHAKEDGFACDEQGETDPCHEHEEDRA